MSTLGICPFSLLKTSLAALICADGRNFFAPVWHNVTSHQKQGFCPGQGHGDKAQLGKCHLLGEQPCEKDALPAPKQHCSLHPAFQGHMLSAAGGQTAGICQELHLAHGVEKDRGAAVVCGTNVEEYVLIHNVPGQRSHASALTLDGEHDGWHVGSAAENSF